VESKEEIKLDPTSYLHQRIWELSESLSKLEGKVKELEFELNCFKARLVPSYPYYNPQPFYPSYPVHVECSPYVSNLTYSPTATDENNTP
jgi:hypothetical protein